MTADSLEIVIEPHAFDRAKSGLVTGPIWLRHEGADFPESGWRDFPVAILSSWLTQLTAVTRGTGEAVCSFMDGPFEFKITNERPGVLRLQFVERGIDDERPIEGFSVPASTLHVTLHAAVATTLSECARRGWSSTEVENLRALASNSRH